MESLIAACVAFVGFHFLLSHPLRRPIVGRIGGGPFLGLYSLVALLTFGWMVVAFRAIPPEPLWWDAGDIGWGVASAVVLVASILFVGSLFGNPALPNPAGTVPRVREPKGVFTITRHPMMWGFALWALVHFAVFPTAADAVLTATILILALVGAALQDSKKIALQPQSWPDWEARTSFLPFARQFAGRARWTAGGTTALLGGTVLWLAATWAHVPAGGAIAAGIWRWIG
ncbi:MAG: NnrU family protein [Sphingomonas sp.]